MLDVCSLFPDLPVIEYMKTLGPSAIDVEIRSLGPEGGGSETVMGIFLTFIKVTLKTRKNFEIAQAYLGLFLKVPSAVQWTMYLSVF